MTASQPIQEKLCVFHKKMVKLLSLLEKNFVLCFLYSAKMVKHLLSLSEKNFVFCFQEKMVKLLFCLFKKNFIFYILKKQESFLAYSEKTLCFS
jgi:hypothetical protein